MAAFRLCLLALLALFAASALSSATVEDGKRVLVLLEGNHVKDTHSIFFDYLKSKGFSLKFALADSPSLALRKYGERLFDHLVVFAPSVEQFGGSVSAESIATFVDEGGNVLVAGDSNIGEAVRDIASSVGFEFDEAGTSVIDYINNEGGEPTLVKSDGLTRAAIIAGPASSPILFRGVAMVQDTENPLTIPVLRGSPTCYSFKADADVSDFPFAVGKSAVLVGALQARNNARVVLSGSLDLFSNELLINDKAGNKKEYSILIEEKREGKWVPYGSPDLSLPSSLSPSPEVQLEFVRIDPFVRRTLNNTNGLFHTTFALPDVYGIFQFRLSHTHMGYTHISSRVQVSVRPLTHTQYERFLVAAYPYYASVWSMMLGVFVFAFVFLYHREKPVAK